MNESIYKISLDIHEASSQHLLHIKKNDTGRKIVFTLTENGLPYKISSECTATFRAKKPDGNILYNNCVIADNKITYTLTQQTSASVGIEECEVTLYGANNKQITSPRFSMVVEDTLYSDNEVESTNEFTQLTQMHNKVSNIDTSESARVSAENSRVTAESSRASAESTRVSDENTRKSAETSRASAETARVNAESSRVTAETARASAETTRQNNEDIRQASYQNKYPTPYKSLTTPSTITDSLGGTIKNAVIIGTSYQNGTPTPTAPIEIQNTGDTLKLTSCGGISSIFPIGSEITINRGNNPIVWRIVDYNHFDLVSGKTEPMLTLEMKNVYGSETAYKPLTFDAPEALYYAEEALSAGTYHFTFNYSSSSVVSGTYQFTLTQAVPVGGQIVIDTNSSTKAITDCKISTYSEIGGTVAIESNIDVTAGSNGTDLGTTGSGNLNHPHRILWGNNNYAQSALRQWLNSSADLGSVWSPTNKFDRAPSWNTSTDIAYKGFMFGFDSEFLGAVQATVIPCRTNSVYEVNSTDGSEFAISQTYNLNDKFFLLSRPEKYGTWDSTTYKDGELLDFYDGLTDIERKKFDAFGTIRYAWLRSPLPSYACRERIVNSAGSLYGSDAFSSTGVAAACVVSVANMIDLINNGKATYSTLDNIDIYTIPLTDINGTSHIMRQFDEVKKHSDGKWYFESNSKIYSFVGTENIYESTNLNGYYINLDIKSSAQIGTGFSNRFKWGETGSTLCFKGVLNVLRMYQFKTLYPTIADFKTQLTTWNTAGDPLTVLYQTTTTTSYELSATTSALLDSIAIKKGNANIYFTNAVAPTMTADYFQDLQLYCNSLEARVEALENIQ